MILLVDRAVGLFTLLLVSTALALANLDLLAMHSPIRWLVLGAIGAIGVMAAGFTMACSTRGVGSSLFNWVVHRLPFATLVRRAVDALRAFRHHRRELFEAAALSLVGHAALATLFVAAGSALLPEATPPTAAFLAILGMFANALPVTPGGIGVGEAAFEALFALTGVAGGARLMLAWRVGLLPLLLVGGASYMTRGVSPTTREPAVHSAALAGTGQNPSPGWGRTEDG